MREIINPAIKSLYPDRTYEVKQSVGIDTSPLFVARTGIRGSNDLVWVGGAANYAAKLCSLRSGNYCSWITEAIYDGIHSSAKFGTNGTNMWEREYWSARNTFVYKSSWQMEPG